ncbi:MAG: DUF4956 domain-containing protein [Bacteroidia bacterium]|nr:DUF4956 domain-containing protein [Bacteroidia bacterium]
MGPTDQFENVTNLSQASSMSEFLIRFLLNLFVIFVVVRLIYYNNHKNKDFLFTFFLFNIINFLICFLLSTAKLKMGFAFGLFAIFSILRYRTVTVPVREMGYFFISVTLGIINALASLDDFMIQLLIANAVILITTFILDGKLTLTHENYKEIIYERIDLIQPDKRQEMLDDLRNRTGLNIHRVEFFRIDFLKDVAKIHAFYYSDKNEAPLAGLNQGGDD